MEWSELKRKTMGLLSPVYGERESSNIIRILKEDLCINTSVPGVDDMITWDKSVQRLLNHEPLAYITGITWFLNLKLKVGPGVLIPRPETEELAALVLKSMDVQRAMKVLDIGTGSGCLALAIKSTYPSSEVYAIDISDDALSIAQDNADLLHLNIFFRKVDIFSSSVGEELPYDFDIIISNPPYIKRSERDLMSISTLMHEPETALFAGDSGLDFYFRIAELGISHLNPNGRIFVEINEYSGLDTMNIFQRFGYRDINLHQDLSGKDRLITCIKK